MKERICREGMQDQGHQEQNLRDKLIKIHRLPEPARIAQS